MGKDETDFWIDRFDVCYKVAKSENVSLMLYWSLGLIFDMISSRDSLNYLVGQWIDSFRGMKDVEEKRCSKSYRSLSALKRRALKQSLCWYDQLHLRMKTGEMGIIETKGKETEQDRVKKRFLQEWIDAVNQHGGFGKWMILKSKLSTI